MDFNNNISRVFVQRTCINMVKKKSAETSFNYLINNIVIHYQARAVFLVKAEASQIKEKTGVCL